MVFLNLPIVMIENIFSYLSYDEIAKNRVVCRAFNDICQRMLTRGFMVIERRHTLSLKSVKSQLPRRESERRYHPLSRHCDILTSIETRISMLNMTYSKFIDHNICCFIPGKVIDEIRRVLQIVESSTTPPRAHEVLQELRDISSMAIEHFDDKISPAFRKKLQEGVAINSLTNNSMMGAREAVTANLLANSPAWRQEFWYIRRRSIMNARLSLHIATESRKMYKMLLSCRNVIVKQRRTIKDLTARQSDQEAAIADLKKRIEECDIKYSELTHTNQAVGGKTIAASSGEDGHQSSSVHHQPLRHFASQIKLDLSVLPIGTSKRHAGKSIPNMKPRKSLIKLPSLSDDEPSPKVPKLDQPNDRNTVRTATPVTKGNSTLTERNRALMREKISNLNFISHQLDGLSYNMPQRRGRLGKRSLTTGDYANTETGNDNNLSPKKQKID